MQVRARLYYEPNTRRMVSLRRLELTLPKIVMTFIAAYLRIVEQCTSRLMVAARVGRHVPMSCHGNVIGYTSVPHKPYMRMRVIIDASAR